MNYISTRGYYHLEGNPTFTQILLEGLAPDGGLYLPETYPNINLETLKRWSLLSYADLAFEILSLFASDIPLQTLKELCHKTYTQQVYCHARSDENPADITPVRLLGVEKDAPLALLGLSNGPTLAFKDMAMQLLGNLFEYVLTQTGKQLNIVGATSGDTGSAAEYAMRGKQHIKVFMLSPHNKMSAFQQAQMFSIQDANIFNIAMTGWFDDCQDVVKQLSEDLDFKRTHHIGAVNSINWGRIVAQIVYYFKGYYATIQQLSHKKIGDVIDVCVPSGNFGNVCAAHIARQMGLPLGRLIVATNENNVLEEFFRTGHYRVRNSTQTLETTSPSMDISKASNFERFVFDLVGRDSVKTQALMKQVSQEGGFDLKDTPEFLAVSSQYGFISGTSNHAHRMAVIRDVFLRYGVLIDTHTADGVKVAREQLRTGVPMLVLETALPIKFSETIKEVLKEGQTIPRPAGFEGLEHLPKRFDIMNPNVQLLKDYIQVRV